MRTIESVAVFPVHLPMVKGFRFASGSAGSAGGKAPHVFVKVTDSEGEVGWGEARPVPQWSYETLETVTTTLKRYLAPAVTGLPVTDRWLLQKRMFQAVGRGPSTGQPIAKAALDIALHDLCARIAQLPLRCYLGGGRERHTVALSYTLTSHDTDAVQDDIEEAKAQGFKHFNFKAAITPETDIAVAKAIKNVVDHDAYIWADANQGFELHEARRVGAAFAEIGVGVLEQPLAADQLHLMRALRAGVQVPLAVDEASVSPADFFHYAAEGLVDYLVVKLTRSGGLWPTLQQIAVAEAAGLAMLVSGLTDGLLTKLAACQVALTYGFTGPAALNGSQFIDESTLYPEKSTVERDGSVSFRDQIGIGIHPDEQALKRFLVKE